MHAPVIGLPACLWEVRGSPFHLAGHKYVEAVAGAAGGIPLVIPALGAAGEPGGLLDLDTVLDRLDGLLFTGSPSNVLPSRYGGPDSAPGTFHDPARDATTLPLIRRAIGRGLPVLAICRGMQELNVALGGSLHQRIQELPGRMDHRAPEGPPPDVRYGPRHDVAFRAGGFFAALAGGPGARVNSLHAQGIDALAPGLQVEATAPDGTIEAVRLDGADFVVGVQWHPEWNWRENALSRALLAAFGAAARNRSRTPQIHPAAAR